MQNNLSRFAWIDVLRTFAIIGVLFVHTLVVLLGLDGGTGASARSLIAIALTCVPIFFMVSGALVLPRANQQPLSKYLIFKPVAIIALIFIWEFIYKAVDGSLNGKTFTISETLKAIMKGSPDNSILWYLYRIAGVYLAAPFLAAMVSACNTKQLTVFVILSLGFDIFLRSLNEIFGISWWSPIDYRIYTLWFGYFVAGYLIANRLSDKYERPAFWLGVAAAGILITTTLNEVFRIIKGAGAPLFIGYDDLGIALASIGIFGYCSSYRKKISTWPFQAAFSYIGRATLGIYMIHILIIITLRNKFGVEQDILYAAAYAFIAGASSLALTAVIIKIPLARRLVTI